MKLVVGLGNPGKEYEKTRHNIGFSYLDFLAKKYEQEFKKSKFNALELTLNLEEKIIFIKPLSYMNLVGSVVKKYIDYYKIAPDDLLIIQDDLDMEVGKIKLTYAHGDGGHNGIKDINKNLNTKDYLRLKIGISNDKLVTTYDYVLGKLNLEAEEQITKSFQKLENLISDLLVLSKSELMNKYNSKDL